MRIGVIGLGNHFLEHILGAVKLSHSIEVTVICDIDSTKIDRASLYLPNAKVTTTWREVFEMDVDMVIGVSYPQLHEALIEQGIKCNIPVFIEKPPFMSSSSIARLMELKKEHGYRKPIGVGINFNFCTMAEIVNNIIASNRYGRVLEVDICHLSNKPDYDIWKINNPLKTMLLAQAIHPLSLMTMFMDSLGGENMSHVTIEKEGLSIVKLMLPGLKDNKLVSGTIRTGNLGPRFLFRMSVTMEDGTRLECTLDRVMVYDSNQSVVAGSNKWMTSWESKAFASGLEKGGYAQEIEAYLQAVRDERDDSIYSPIFFHEIYQIMEKVFDNEEARK